jgi:hypothetical protein
MPNGKVTLKDIYTAINDLRQEVRDGYVTKDEFGPVRSIAYGTVGLILVAVLTAVVANVIKAAL